MANDALRTETDLLGTIDIPADRLWGPQTERARRLFRIGTERFPPGLIRAVGLHKSACAAANAAWASFRPTSPNRSPRPRDEIAASERDDEFPLPVWQTGSGTQTNMNANEVIANRANQMLGQPLGSRKPVHPNDHVNRGQSSNDNFPTMMHIAAVEVVEGRLLPALGRLHAALWRRSEEWADIVKVGRTHLMDAVPVTLGQEFAAWARQVELGQRTAARHPAAPAAAAPGRHGGGHRPEPAPGFRPGVLRDRGRAHGPAPSRRTRTSSRAWARTTPSSSCPA